MYRALLLLLLITIGCRSDSKRLKKPRYGITVRDAARFWGQNDQWSVCNHFISKRDFYRKELLTLYHTSQRENKVDSVAYPVTAAQADSMLQLAARYLESLDVPVIMPDSFTFFTDQGIFFVEIDQEYHSKSGSSYLGYAGLDSTARKELMDYIKSVEHRAESKLKANSKNKPPRPASA